MGRVGHPVLLSVLRSIRLVPDDALTPDLRWLSSLTTDQIDGWVAILPQQVGSEAGRRILGHEPISVSVRQRLKGDYYGPLSEIAHRRPVEFIKRGRNEIGDEAARQLVGTRTGAMLVYPTVDKTGRRGSVPGGVGSALAPA